MRYVSTTYLWLSLALFLLFLQVNRVESRSSQTFDDLRMSRPDGEKQEESRAMLAVLTRRNLQVDADNLCNCSDYCLDPNSSELEKIVWIENHPIFCKETAQIDIDNKPYMAFCFFDCCRKCNVEYFKCDLLEKDAREHCLKKAHECAGHCVKESSLNITIKGW